MSQWFMPETIGLWMDIVTNTITLIAGAIAAVAGLCIWLEHRRNVFKNNVSCTLNIIERRDDGTYLVFRKLYDKTLPEVIRLGSTRRAFLRGVDKCSVKNPFVRVSDEKERGRVTDALISALSSYPGVEQKVAKFLGIDIREKVELIGLPSFEIFEDERDQEVRPWYITAVHLSNFLSDETVGALKTEVGHHGDRIPWLRAMAEIVFHGTTERLPRESVAAVKDMIHFIKF